MNELLNKAKKRLRMSTNALDDDVTQLINEALADISRIGVDTTGTASPLIEGAVLCYVQACFGSNPDREKLMNSYNMYLTKLKGLKTIEG